MEHYQSWIGLLQSLDLNIIEAVWELWMLSKKPGELFLKTALKMTRDFP